MIRLGSSVFHQVTGELEKDVLQARLDDAQVVRGQATLDQRRAT
jgi:hypothetical protein